MKIEYFFTEESLNKKIEELRCQGKNFNVFEFDDYEVFPEDIPVFYTCIYWED